MDKHQGRPILLNTQELEVTDGSAELIFFGDLHWGHPKCDIERARDMLEWALDNRVYVMLMGDLLDANTRDSVGMGVYEQTMNPQRQMEYVIKLLTPLAKEGLIIGMVGGNHELRLAKLTSIDVSMLIANLLSIPYLGYAGWTMIRVGKQKYSIYATHGVGGSKFKHTKLKKVADMTEYITADIIAYGHVHSLAAEPIIKQSVDKAHNRVIETKGYIVLTGSYLEWSGSYAEMFNMPPGKLGSPKCRFDAEEHNFHFSL
jgi:UDP-2,3-diacylglucosamine pyrophosphatase LpxH